MRENAIIKESTELLHQARNNGSITKKEEKTKRISKRQHQKLPLSSCVDMLICRTQKELHSF